MIAYGAVNGQLLVGWGCQSFGALCNMSGLMGTYIAGMEINVVVLTSLASILLLLNSIPTSNKEPAVCKGRYYLGYDLFLIAILGTVAFVFGNAISIHSFTVSPIHVAMNIPVEPLAGLIFRVFLFYAGLLAVVLVMALLVNSVKLLGFFKGGRWHRHGLLILLLFIAGFVAAIAYILAPDAFWIIGNHLSFLEFLFQSI
jgi:hypothetical protein